MTNSSLVLTGKIFSLQSPRDPCRRALSKTKLNTATSPDLQAMGQEKGGKILLLKKKKKSSPNKPTKTQGHQSDTTEPAKYIVCSYRLRATYRLGRQALLHVGSGSGRCEPCGHLCRSQAHPGITQKIHFICSFQVWHFWREQGDYKVRRKNQFLHLSSYTTRPGFVCFVCFCVKWESIHLELVSFRALRWAIPLSQGLHGFLLASVWICS